MTPLSEPKSNLPPPLSERMQGCVPDHPWVAEVAALERDLSASRAEVARLTAELREAWLRDEKHWEERNKARRQVEAYRRTLVLAGPVQFLAVEDADPVLMPTPESLTAMLENRDALRSEVVRLREALHPGGRPHDVVRGKDGTWAHPGSCDDGGTCRWCWEADRFERLTGLDAVTGEKR